MEKKDTISEIQYLWIAKQRLTQAVSAFWLSIALILNPAYADQKKNSAPDEMYLQMQYFFLQDKYWLEKALKQRVEDHNPRNKNALFGEIENAIEYITTVSKKTLEKRKNSSYPIQLIQKNKQAFYPQTWEKIIFLMKLCYWEGVDTNVLLDQNDYENLFLQFSFIKTQKWEYILKDIFITGNYYKSEK